MLSESLYKININLQLKNQHILSLKENSIEHLHRVQHANRGRLLRWTTGPVRLLYLQVF